MRKMTIHRALTELKTLDDRITKGILVVDPVGIRQLDKPILASHGAVYKDETTFNTDAESNYKSVLQLIKNKSAIKAAIVTSNSTQTVEVGGRKMTVAEAITEKSYIALKRELLVRLTSCQRKNEGQYKVISEKVEANLQLLLSQSVGKDQTKVSSEDIDAIRKPYLKANEAHIVDPLVISTKIKDLQEEISKFEADVDACLSESNAVTIIEIED